VVPHFHLPLQSGSDKILKAMRRRYLTTLYEQRINYIKTLMLNCCIGVDVITGFPGETENDFLETYNFLNKLDVSYLHVFTYSERDNTHALSLDGVVSLGERKKRTKMLRILSEKKLRNFYSQHSGKVYDILFEGNNKNGYMHGFTQNYIKVKTLFNPELINHIVSCKLTNIDENGEMLIDFKESPALQNETIYKVG
jgi:threonylcarbamoyladenosine tRNA methylthiotransferase MtaB